MKKHISKNIFLHSTSCRVPNYPTKYYNVHIVIYRFRQFIDSESCIVLIRSYALCIRVVCFDSLVVTSMQLCHLNMTEFKQTVAMCPLIIVVIFCISTLNFHSFTNMNDQCVTILKFMYSSCVFLSKALELIRTKTLNFNPKP